MADAADRAQQDTEVYQASIPKNYHIAPGTEGDCGECGEYSKRLIDGMCACCRDRIQRYRALTGRR